MANWQKHDLLDAIESRVSRLNKISGSQSLFSIGDDVARVYLRYSKVHDRGRTFFGLRSVDLQQLAGRRSFICFYMDDGSPPLFVPYADFEEIFREAPIASDGQYKVQILTQNGTRELYVPKKGRFNVDGFAGINTLVQSVECAGSRRIPDLSHCQVQTLLASIGNKKGFDVFVPASDAGYLDWSLAPSFRLRDVIPAGFEGIGPILSEIDVLWITAGRNTIAGLFEVEHTTSVYSGLLRFNDVLLTDPRVSSFFIVSNETRRELYSRQIHRPTFRKSGLSDIVSFLEYGNVYDWHGRLVDEADTNSGVVNQIVQS